VEAGHAACRAVRVSGARTYAARAQRICDLGATATKNRLTKTIPILGAHSQSRNRLAQTPCGKVSWFSRTRPSGVVIAFSPKIPFVEAQRSECYTDDVARYLPFLLEQDGLFQRAASEPTRVSCCGLGATGLTKSPAQSNLGSYAWSAQYQQDPVPRAAAILDPELFLPLTDDLRRRPSLMRMQFWDTAFSGRATADHTAAVTLDVEPAGISEPGCWASLLVGCRPQAERAPGVLVDEPRVRPHQGVSDTSCLSAWPLR
jgi:hypothetical protein